MFLRKVYQQWRTFFWLILIALCAQFFFMVKGIENVPFFLYHMYSAAHQPKDSFNVILIKTPKGYPDLSRLSGREFEMLMNNVPNYIKMKRNSNLDNIIPTVESRFKGRVTENTWRFLQQGLINDSTDLSGYPGWWQRYYTSIFGDSLDSVSLISTYIFYQPAFSKSPVDSVIFNLQIQ